MAWHDIIIIHDPDDLLSVPFEGLITIGNQVRFADILYNDIMTVLLPIP